MGVHRHRPTANPYKPTKIIITLYSTITYAFDKHFGRVFDFFKADACNPPLKKIPFLS